MPYSHPESVGLDYKSNYDFSGGMVTNYNFRKFAPNQSLKCLNADLTTDGAVTKRKGRVKINSTAISSNPTVLTLHAFGQSSGADLIYAQAADGKLYEVSTGTLNTLKTGLSSSVKLSYTDYSTFTFACNGTDSPIMTQGAALTTYNVGIAAVTSLASFAVAAAVGGDGTAGAHRVTYRYRSTLTGARSNPLVSASTISSTSVTLAGPNFTYSITFPVGLVNADAQVDTIDYFVQEAGAVTSAPYYYLGSSANAAGTYTFGTNVSDDELIIKERLDIDDNVMPTSCFNVEEWRGRLCAISDVYTVRYSKIRIDQNSITNLPTSWPSTNSLRVGYGDGDPLKKIIRFGDYLIAFKRRSIWLLEGDFDSSNFQFKRLRTNIPNVGLLNPECVVIVDNRLFFLSDDLKFHYFYMTDFSQSELRLQNPPPSDSIGDLFSQTTAAYRDKINLVNYSYSLYSQIWISFNDGSGLSSSANFNSFVFDYNADAGKGAWSLNSGHEIASSCLARDNTSEYFVCSGDYYGFVWAHDGTTDGDGAEVNGTSTGGNTSTSINDTTKTFSTSLIGCFVSIIGGTGEGQIRRVTARLSATELTVNSAWETTPDSSSIYTVGGIDFQVWGKDDSVNDEAPAEFQKHAWYIDVDIETNGDYGYTLQIQQNRSQGIVVDEDIINDGVTWDEGVYDTSVWNDSFSQYKYLGLNFYFKQLSIRVINKYAGQFVKLNGWTITFQTLGHERYQ